MAASLQRVQKGRDDEHDALAQERAVDEHEGVQRADQLSEVHISGVDFNASEHFVLNVFQQFYRDALRDDQHRWHGTLLAWDIQKLSPEEAIKSCTLIAAKHKRFSTQTHGGTGFLAVANPSVEKLLIQVSEIQGQVFDCTPPDRTVRRRATVKRSNRNRRRRDSSSVRDPWAVSHVEMIDMDARDRVPPNKFPIRRLWAARVAGVHTTLLH